MKLNFCTLFDSFYLTRGLAMYHSLERQSKDFHLYIFAFDQDSYTILKKLNLTKATIISLNDFESEKLLSVKNSRTQAEYCWTSTPSTILYCIEQFKLDHCTYLDADLYFYADPIEIIKKAGDNSVIITPHHYTKKYDQTLLSGKYCVQFMYFKNDQRGLKVLNWWLDACIDWCYARVEDGKFGDQKYLDSWEANFEGIYSTEELGIGLAPWNIQQVDLDLDEEGSPSIILKATGKKTPLYFYHFHGLKFLSNGKIDLSDYELNEELIRDLYIPYVNELLIQYQIVKRIADKPKLKSIVDLKKGLRYYKKVLTRKLKNEWNILEP